MSRAVIDQPGVRILAIGLTLSVFLGLALRAQLSEARIQVFLNKSIDRLQSDFHIDYESAKVNLSRWGLPLPALIIQNLRLSPKSTTCQSSQVFIEELEVPISFSIILGLSKTIPKIRVKDIELRLSDIENCLGQNSLDKSGVKPIEKPADSPTEVAEASVLPVMAETDFKNIFSNNTKAELKEIYVEQIKIISKKKPDQPIVLRQINFELFYNRNHLSEVQIKSKISALKDNRSDVYFLNSNLIARIKSNEKNEIESLVSVNGKLLDGDIQFFTHAFSDSHKINYELGLHHVSLKALSPLFENTEIYKKINIEKIPVSVSFSNSGEVYLNDKISFNSKFKKVSVNIDNGQINLNELDAVYSGNNLTIKPFDMNIESLPLSMLKNIDQFKNRLNSFDSLGMLSGYLDYKNENSFKFKGLIKNIKAVFSNRSRRDLQNIERVEIAASRVGSELLIEASNFIINNEKIEGQLKAQHNVANFETRAQLNFTGLTLNSKIWEQFTFVEQSPRIELQWNYKKNSVESHHINIIADKINIPGVRLEKLHIDIAHTFSDRNEDLNNLNVSIKPAKLATDPGFLENNIVAEVLNEKNGFKLESLTSSKTSILLTGSDWKNIKFNLDSYFLSDVSSKSDTHLTLKGSVKYEIGLDGRLVFQNHNNLIKFDLSSSSDDKVSIRRIP